jgi:two-component system OmpR family sensor kinase
MTMARARHSLSRALTRALLPWIAMLWVATSAAVGWYMQHELTEQLDAGLVESAERLLDLAAHDARNHQNPSERDGTLYRLEVPHSNLSGAHHDVLLYQVVNDRNELLLRSADAPLTPLPVPLNTGFFDTPKLRTYTLAHPSLPMFIHVGDPLAHRSAARTQVLLGLLVPLLVILPLLGLLIRAVTQRALAPAGTLAAELQLRDGNHLAALPGQGLPDELQTIVDSANHLLARLSDALDTERALAANAAHELRTPLAAVRLNLQTALVHVPTGAAYTDIQGALQSLDRLSRRCEKLLQLSRAGSGAALAQDRVNLAQVAAAVAQEFWADAALLQRLQLVLPEDDDVWVRGDFDALAIALRNLVENAFYAPWPHRAGGGATGHLQRARQRARPHHRAARAVAAAPLPRRAHCQRAVHAWLWPGAVHRDHHRGAPGRHLHTALAPTRSWHGTASGFAPARRPLPAGNALLHSEGGQTARRLTAGVHAPFR